jgi:hypothetical protein
VNPHYVISSCEAVTDAYLQSGYKRSVRTPLEQLGANTYKLLGKEERAGLVVLEIDAEQHGKLNAPAQASRPVFAYGSFMRAARVERVDVLERGQTTSIVSPVINDGGGFNESYATGDCDTIDLHLTSERCAQSMERSVRQAIDEHLDAIAELRKFLETKQ